MNPLETEVLLACEQVAIGYARAVDAGDGQRAASYFAEDGLLEMPGGHSYRGPIEIAQRLLDQPKDQVSRHLVSNFSLEMRSSDVAAGQAYVTIYRATRTSAPGPLPLDGPYLVGQYDDEYRRTDLGWLLARRRLTTIFKRTDA